MKMINLQNTGIVGKQRKVGYHSNKVLQRENTLISIFKERTAPQLGLTKKEVIAKYYNYNITEVFAFKQEKIKVLWEEINDARKILRKEQMIAIVPLDMPSGSILDDSSLSNPISKRQRQLKQRTSVYHSCSDMNVAHVVRKRYDKIVEGIEKAGDDVETITEQGIKQKPILETLNHEKNLNKNQKEFE